MHHFHPYLFRTFTSPLSSLNPNKQLGIVLMWWVRFPFRLSHIWAFSRNLLHFIRSLKGDSSTYSRNWAAWCQICLFSVFLLSLSRIASPIAQLHRCSFLSNKTYNFNGILLLGTAASLWSIQLAERRLPEWHEADPYKKNLYVVHSWDTYVHSIVTWSDYICNNKTMKFLVEGMTGSHR